MVWAVPALAAAPLCLCVSTDLMKVTVATLIIGAILSKAEHPQLGVCDLEPGIIGSDPSTLEKLKLCPALTGAQQDALNALLLSGRSEYGDPSSWDLQTLQDLGPLVLALNQTTLSLVAEAAREDFRSLAASSITQGHSQRDKPLLLPGAAAASLPRLKRSLDRCRSDPITAKNIIEILSLSLEQLDLCLSNDVLIENLEDVLVLPITSEISQVLKKKVDESFPLGLPERQLRRLGTLSRFYTEQEISQWLVTSSDTLSALLSPSGGQWDDSQVQQLISRYLALGGSWSGPLLQEMGGKQLCQLQEEQIQQIPAAAIGTAGQLDISTCSQAKKEQLYGKAREAFASLGSSPSSYYCRIRPYLGGAPAEDLKDLADAGVAINMDLHTFLALNPEELQKLSVTDVKHLLGENLPELKKAEHEPSVESWVQNQSQQELDCVLGIGLQGGQPGPTGTASPAPATATSGATATSPVPTTPATATSTPTVPISPHPPTSANVTPVHTTLSSVPRTSASVTSMATNPVPTTLTTVPTPPHPSASVTVPTPSAISSHSTPQPSTVPPRTPTPSTPTPSDTPTHTGGPPVPPVPPATPSARPAVTSAPPCPTQQTDRATSPAVPPTSLPATSSPSATPVPAVTSGATTGAGAGTDLAGATHSTATTVPNPSSAPTVTHSTVTSVPTRSSSPTVTPVPHSSSAATVASVPNSSSAPTATHSTVTSVPKPSSALPATPVPKPSSAPTATPAPKPCSSPTVTSVPKPSSSPTSTPVPNPSSAPTVTSVPNPTSAPTATPVPPSPSAPAATAAPHTPTPIPNSTTSTQKPLGSSPPVPCQPSPSSNPKPTPGNVPEPPRTTSNGYINLQPEPGSGSRLCSCLVPVLAATTMSLLLWGLL